MNNQIKKWFVSTTGNHQGLVIDENDGRNVAVTYDKADAPLIAAAPKLLAALERAHIALEKSVHFESGLPFWRKGGDGYAAMLDARAAIAEATGKE
jgi:hypothetical protein